MGFVKIHQETYGKSGARRIVPGQYLATDPKGRSVMIAAMEKAKLVYILNRDAAANLTISWYLAFIVDIVPIVVNFILSIAWGHVSEEIKTKLELYSSVKDTIKPVFYAASAWASWVIIFSQIYGLYDMDDSSQSRALYTERVSIISSWNTMILISSRSTTWSSSCSSLHLSYASRKCCLMP